MSFSSSPFMRVLYCMCVVFMDACVYAQAHLCEGHRKMLDDLLALSLYCLRQSLSMNQSLMTQAPIVLGLFCMSMTMPDSLMGARDLNWGLHVFTANALTLTYLYNLS